MAYEYGTVHMGYDSKRDGHEDFEALILSVYKAANGLESLGVTSGT
jgi:hypothetical protein